MGRRPDKLLRLERLLEQYGKVTVDRIAQDIYGGVDAKSLTRARGLISAYRKRERRHGNHFYSVNRQHQILDGSNYIEASNEYKDRVRSSLQQITAIISDGYDRYPELANRLELITVELQRGLLDSKEAHLKSLIQVTHEANNAEHKQLEAGQHPAPQDIQ